MNYRTGENNENIVTGMVENYRIKRVSEAINTLYATFNELTAAWLELDDQNNEEEEIINKLNKFYPRSLTGSLDDIATDIYRWSKNVQEKPNSLCTDTEHQKSSNRTVKLHEFLQSIHIHQRNMPAISIRNELCIAFGGLNPQCKIDVDAEIKRWESNEDIILWYGCLAEHLQAMILKYYCKTLNLRVDTTSPYTKEELVNYISDLGQLGGGCINITGKCNGELIEIIVDQNEWNDSPVCLVGGYGYNVQNIEPQKILKELPDVLNNYFDCDSDFTIEEY